MIITLKNCNHIWSNWKYDPDWNWGYRQDGLSENGNVLYERVRYDVSRWSRTCLVCDETEYVYKEPI